MECVCCMYRGCLEQTCYIEDYPKMKFFRKLFSECTEDWSKTHGYVPYSGSVERENIICPFDGIVNKIEVTHSIDENGRRFIGSLSFKCLSSLGERDAGTFGEVNLNDRNVLTCDDRHYISSFSGAFGSRILELSAKCIDLVETYRYGKAVYNSTQETKQTKYYDEEIREFNDECYTTNGRRPVEFIVWYNEFVIAIAVKYLKTPVRKNCRLSHIEVAKNDVDITETNFEVIGLTSGFTCSSLAQQINLDVTQSRSSSDSAGTSKTSDDSDVHISQFMGAGGYDGYFQFLFVLEKENGVIFHHITENTQSNSYSNEMQYSMGTTIDFKGPGMALLVGLKVNHKIVPKKIPAYVHYTCKGGGSKPPELIEIDFHGDPFANVLFLDFQSTFNSTEECMSSSYPHECLAGIRINNFITNLDELEEEFNNCISSKKVNIPYQP